MVNFNKLAKSIGKSIKNCAWFFSFSIGVYAFTFKIPYCVVLGVMLLSISFIFFPWQDKILSRYNIKLGLSNKIFIIISNIVVAAYSINPEEKSYYRCILPIAIFILIWLLIILFKKRKNK